MRCAQRFLPVHGARELILVAGILRGGVPDLRILPGMDSEVARQCSG